MTARKSRRAKRVYSSTKLVSNSKDFLNGRNL